MCDSIAPSIYNTSTPKARKDHTCFECGCKIPKGTIYEFVDGMWDGDFKSFKTCNDCVSLRKVLLNDINYCMSHGGLLEEVEDDITWLDCKYKFSAHRKLATIYKKQAEMYRNKKLGIS